jgi:hypothetical protein
MNDQLRKKEISTVKNDFVLRYISEDIEKFDEIFKGLIVLEEFDAILINFIILKPENKVLYRVRISLASLFEFKKRLEETTCYHGFELFEYKEW